MIDVQDLTHRYAPRRRDSAADPQGRLALDRVSFHVPRGTLTALLGPNGSGKSTLFRVLSTLTAPTAGSARIDGLDVVRDRSSVRARIGVVFQNPSLDKQLTARENLAYHGRLFGLSGGELRARIDAALAEVDLGDRSNDRTGAFSGGMRRRVEIAKALLTRPAVLLLDEPSTGLDPGARLSLRTTLAKLRAAGMTILLTTHVLDEAESADQVVLLDEGKMVALDTPAGLVAATGGAVVHLGGPDLAALGERVRAVAPGTTVRAAAGELLVDHADPAALLPRLAQEAGGLLASFRVVTPSLEDAFLRRTGKRLHDPAVETPR
jgi:ABC-2 type transport system ATP-binding protein